MKSERWTLLIIIFFALPRPSLRHCLPAACSRVDFAFRSFFSVAVALRLFSSCSPTDHSLKLWRCFCSCICARRVCESKVLSKISHFCPQADASICVCVRCYRLGVGFQNLFNSLLTYHARACLYLAMVCSVCAEQAWRSIVKLTLSVLRFPHSSASNLNNFLNCAQAVGIVVSAKWRWWSAVNKLLAAWCLVYAWKHFIFRDGWDEVRRRRRNVHRHNATATASKEHTPTMSALQTQPTMLPTNERIHFVFLFGYIIRVGCNVLFHINYVTFYLF